MQKKLLMITLVLISPFLFSACLNRESQKNIEMGKDEKVQETVEPTLSQDTNTESLEKDLETFKLEEETFE